MKKRKRPSKSIGAGEFMLANRRAAREEEIAAHGKPVSGRKMLHRSRRVYDRKRLGKIEVE